LRPYKNIDLLVQAFQSWRCDTARLIIAGKPVTSAYGAELAKKVSGDYRIDLRLTHVSDADVGRFYTAADAAIFPFNNVLNSGSLLLALTMGRPVLVPHTPVFAELAAKVGASWVRLYDGRLDAAALNVFARSLDEQRSALRTDGLSWDKISTSTEDFYRMLLRKRGKTE
jgi:glycosyltransferase involved in cell wall biosynthesis